MSDSMENIAILAILAVLAVVLVGFCMLLWRTQSDGLKSLKGKCDILTASLISSDRSTGCVSGAIIGYFDGQSFYSRNSTMMMCLLEATSSALCCVVLTSAGDTEGRSYTIYLDDIEKCEVRERRNDYKVSMIAQGRKSVFVVYKHSPHEIIPEQEERAENLIKLLRKAV